MTIDHNASTTDSIPASVLRNIVRQNELYARRGYRIWTRQILMRLANERKCVIVKGWPQPCPAAFIISMRFNIVCKLLDNRGIFTHESLPKN